MHYLQRSREEHVTGLFLGVGHLDAWDRGDTELRAFVRGQ